MLIDASRKKISFLNHLWVAEFIHAHEQWRADTEFVGIAIRVYQKFDTDIGIKPKIASNDALIS